MSDALYSLQIEFSRTSKIMQGKYTRKEAEILARQYIRDGFSCINNSGFITYIPGHKIDEIIFLQCI